jgi:hypothetical protein
VPTKLHLKRTRRVWRFNKKLGPAALITRQVLAARL